MHNSGLGICIISRKEIAMNPESISQYVKSLGFAPHRAALGLCAAAALAAGAWALNPAPVQAQQAAAKAPEPHPGASPDLAKYADGLPERNDYVSWKTLADVKVTREKDKIRPTFPASVTKLDAQTVKLQGFMVPLDATSPTQQKHFVLTALPQSCSFCLPPVGMEGMIEVRAKTAVKFGYEPVQVVGKFAVLKDDPLGIYYRLVDAEPVK